MSKQPVTFEQHFKSNVKLSRTDQQTTKFVGFSRKLEMIFDEIGQSKTKKVLVFWQMMLKTYETGMRETYGIEPDQHFVDLAVSLTKRDMKRIADNVQDLLVNNRTFAPAHEALKMLAQRPTRFEINIALRDLYEQPKPSKQLNRVNKYIKEFYYAKIRALKTDGCNDAFEKLYVNIWRDVMIYNSDLRIKSQQDAVKKSIENVKDNWSDKKVTQDLENGRAFDNPFGKRIMDIMAYKKNQQRGSFVE